jgi:hypothetical protein
MTESAARAVLKISTEVWRETQHLRTIPQNGARHWGFPFLFNLYTNPREDTDKQITDSWVIGPVLKMIGAFEASVKKHPLIAMGTPDPYTPPN